jgi:hypothetical protein
MEKIKQTCGIMEKKDGSEMIQNKFIYTDLM